MKDWELKHKELCKKDAEERKVKGNREERTTSEKENLEKISGILTHIMEGKGLKGADRDHLKGIVANAGDRKQERELKLKLNLLCVRSCQHNFALSLKKVSDKGRHCLWGAFYLFHRTLCPAEKVKSVERGPPSPTHSDRS